MICSNCHHNEEIARLREICLKCHLGNGVAGDSSVSLDAIKADGTLDRLKNVAPGCKTYVTFDPDLIDAKEKPETEEARKIDNMRTLLACMANADYADLKRLFNAMFTGKLDDDTKTNKIEFFTESEFDVFSHCIRGYTMAEYAKKSGDSKQAAWARIQKLFDSRPIFRAIANGKMTHGKGGSVARAKKVTQQDLFTDHT